MGEKKQRRLLTLAPGILLAGILAILVVLFIFMQVANLLTRGITTTTATRITVDESFSENGWFIRDEVLASGTTSETVKHIVRSGEKVQQNAALAVIYADAATLNASQEVERLTDEIDLLRSALQTAGSYDDTAKLDQLIASQIASLAAQAHDGMVTNISSAVSSLRQLSLRRSAGSLDAVSLQAQIDDLTARKDTLLSQTNGRSTVISSPAAGYFSEIVDGFEGVLTTEMLETINLKSFRSLNDQMASPNESALGKIICGFEWYFAIPATNQQLADLRVGSALRLRFPQLADDLSVTVHDIRRENGAEEALLILKGTAVDSEVVTMRRQTAEVIRSTYTGIKIPKSAIHMQISTDDEGNELRQLGVYILTGTVQRFKAIEPIYEADTFYVIEEGRTADTASVVVGDEIITQAHALEERVIR